MRRTTALIAATLVGGAMLLSGCGSQQAPDATGSPALAPAAAVHAAVLATSTSGTARVTLTSTTTVGSTKVPVSAAGVVALDGSKADMTLTMPGSMLGGGSTDVTVHEIVVDKTIYLKFTGSSLLPDTWVSVGAGAALSKAGLGDLAAGATVTGQLDALRDLGDVTVVGEETVNGRQSTHYRATIDPAKLAATVAKLPAGTDVAKALGTTPIPVDLWIDSDGRVVRSTLSFSMTVSGTKIAEDVRSDLTDFGAPLTVTAPAGAVDLGGLLGTK